MINITIREVRGEERADIARPLGGYAFSPTPPLHTREEELKHQEYRSDALCLALFVNEHPMAIAVCSPMQQNIRGTLYSGGGIHGVAVHPEARRNGYARQLLTQLLAELHARGEVVSTLYPFRESFYQRLGYTTFPQPRTIQFPASVLQPLLKQELEGKVSMVSLADGDTSYYAYLQKIQPELHGMGLFSKRRGEWQRDQNRYWLAIARVNDEPCGMMLYRINGNQDNMEVPCFYYSDSRGKYLLLEWFARHIDQVKYIEVRLPPGEYPETWIADLSPTIRAEKAPMGRVLDITKLSGLKTGAGDFTARISDPVCPWNEGAYRFETIDGKLQISSATTVDCQLTIQALTALVYGTHDPETFAIRGWGNPSKHDQKTIRNMFSSKQPYLHEVF